MQRPFYRKALHGPDSPERKCREGRRTRLSSRCQRVFPVVACCVVAVLGVALLCAVFWCCCSGVHKSRLREKAQLSEAPLAGASPRADRALCMPATTPWDLVEPLRLLVKRTRCPMLKARIPHAVTSLMPNTCVPAMSADGACCQNVSCSQQTQATIATSPIGTQCVLTVLISRSSQTEGEFPVLEEDDAQAGAAVEKHRASRAGADLAGKPHCICSCRPHPGNKSMKIQFREELYSCPSCQQSNHQAPHGRVGTTTSPYICTVCQKAYREKRSLDIHMRMHNGGDGY
ncbi:uncharacterized protein LOC144158231 isoform X4 [Haemaphysalis longicornis]